MMSRKNQFQLKQILAKRFNIAVEAIARLEIWYDVYFLIVKGRKPKFISKNGFFCVPSGYGLTKRTNANIVSDTYFQIRYMAENTIVGDVVYKSGIFDARLWFKRQGLVGKTFNNISDAIAFVVDNHALDLKLSIIGF